MNAKSLIAFPLTGLVLALALTGCGSSSADQAPVATTPAVTPTATQAPATPAPTSTAPVTVPAAGTTVPAADVAAVRKAGGHVYVSPNGTGDGLVVDPAAALPAVVVADTHAAAPDTAWAADGRAFSAIGGVQKKLAAAYKDAGLSAFLLTRWPSRINADGTIQGTLYEVTAINVGIAKGSAAPTGPTPAAALAAAKAWFDAYPDVPVVTFDDVK